MTRRMVGWLDEEHGQYLHLSCTGEWGRMLFVTTGCGVTSLLGLTEPPQEGRGIPQGARCAACNKAMPVTEAVPA